MNSKLAPGGVQVPIELLAAIAFVVTADIRVVIPLLRVIADEFGADIGDAGAIVTAYALPYGLFQLVYGPIGDRLGKVRVMSFAISLFAIGTAASAIATSIPMLVALRLFTGIAAASFIPLSLSYVGDNVPYQQRQAAIAKLLTGIALGQVLSASLGGIVTDLLRWQHVFLAYGALSLGLGLLLWQRTRGLADPARRIERPLHHALSAYRGLLANPAARIVYVGVFVEHLFFFGGFTYMGAYLRDEFNLSYLLIGLTLSALGIGNLIYTRTAGALVRRLGEQRLLLLGGVIDCGAFLAFALFWNWVALIPVLVVFGVGYYLMHATLQTRATELAPETRGTAVALFAFSIFVGQGVGAALFGAVVDSSGYQPAFLLSAVGLLLLGIGFVLVARPAEPTRPRMSG